ncbi:ankyrin repeat protein [Cotonvirus japonicus]|uniref:Ankyrin repeat protein n=1 Tax=Cotonvirus japonicus TaxID=2811091 RepID=A0ABM7NQX5_9VIRU|nr:ankyrin repeat protein [Cotonvirus japonicus]BCS82550.1 ankyrin repeat protein [Cotonvirus japonicus]
MSSKLYLKITNKQECHNGYQYQDDLNILQEKFNDNPNDSCAPGGLYFCEPKYIHHYFGYGVNLREVYLPTNNPDFKMIKDPEGKKYRANMIILGKKHNLSDPKTWEFMNTIGVKFEKSSLHHIIRKNYFECLKYLISIGVAINTLNYNSLPEASARGRLEIVKYLIPLENNKEIIFEAQRRASDTNNLIMIQYLLGEVKIRYESFMYLSPYSRGENNKKITYDYEHLCEDLFFLNCEYGNLEIIKYLVHQGAKINTDDDYALIIASKYGKLDVVKYLISQGANVHAYKNKSIISAHKYGHQDVIKYLIENGAKIVPDNDNKTITNRIEIDIGEIEEDIIFNGRTYEWKIVQFPNYYDYLKNIVLNNKVKN